MGNGGNGECLTISVVLSLCSCHLFNAALCLFHNTRTQIFRALHDFSAVPNPGVCSVGLNLFNHIMLFMQQNNTNTFSHFAGNVRQLVFALYRLSHLMMHLAAD